MFWPHEIDGHLNLAFAAMCLSAAVSTTYLVRWRGMERIEPFITVYSSCYSATVMDRSLQHHQCKNCTLNYRQRQEQGLHPQRAQNEEFCFHGMYGRC